MHADLVGHNMMARTVVAVGASGYLSVSSLVILVHTRRAAGHLHAVSRPQRSRSAVCIGTPHCSQQVTVSAHASASMRAEAPAAREAQVPGLPHCMHSGGPWLPQRSKRLSFSGSNTAVLRGSSVAGSLQTGGRQHVHRHGRHCEVAPAAAGTFLHPAAGSLPLCTACAASISCRAAPSNGQAIRNFCANTSSLSGSQGQHQPACGCGGRKRAAPGRGQGVIPRAGLDATVQDVLMGGSLAIAIGMALYYGSKVGCQGLQACRRYI